MEASIASLKAEVLHAPKSHALPILLTEIAKAEKAYKSFYAELSQPVAVKVLKTVTRVKEIMMLQPKDTVLACDGGSPEIDAHFSKLQSEQYLTGRNTAKQKGEHR